MRNPEPIDAVLRQVPRGSRQSVILLLVVFAVVATLLVTLLVMARGQPRRPMADLTVVSGSGTVNGQVFKGTKTSRSMTLSPGDRISASIRDDVILRLPGGLWAQMRDDSLAVIDPIESSPYTRLLVERAWRSNITLTRSGAESPGLEIAGTKIKLLSAEVAHISVMHFIPGETGSLFVEEGEIEVELPGGGRPLRLTKRMSVAVTPNGRVEQVLSYRVGIKESKELAEIGAQLIASKDASDVISVMTLIYELAARMDPGDYALAWNLLPFLAEWQRHILLDRMRDRGLLGSIDLTRLKTLDDEAMNEWWEELMLNWRAGM